MTTAEKLAAIRARCVELLEQAKDRTPGEWVSNGPYDGEFEICSTGRLIARVEPDQTGAQTPPNARFIANGAGPAEAGWRATIAVIDSLRSIASFGEGEKVDSSFDEPTSAREARFAISQILAAWEGQV